MALVISIHDVRKIHAWADSSPMKIMSEIDLGQVQLSLFEHEIKSISQHELNGTDDLRRLCRLYILILWDHFVPLVKLENISESELFTGDTSKDNRSLGSGKENGRWKEIENDTDISNVPCENCSLQSLCTSCSYKSLKKLNAPNQPTAVLRQLCHFNF